MGNILTRQNHRTSTYESWVLFWLAKTTEHLLTNHG